MKHQFVEASMIDLMCTKCELYAFKDITEAERIHPGLYKIDCLGYPNIEIVSFADVKKFNDPKKPFNSINIHEDGLFYFVIENTFRILECMTEEEYMIKGIIK